MPVRWRETMLALRDLGAARFVEVGPGLRPHRSRPSARSRTWSWSMLEHVLVPSKGSLPAPTPAGRPTILSVATDTSRGASSTSAELADLTSASPRTGSSPTPGSANAARRRADERLTDYATRAGERPRSSRAGVAAADLDLVIVATLTQDELTPNAAPLVAASARRPSRGRLRRRRGLYGVPVRASSLGAAQIESARADRLLIGADFITRITDYEDKKHGAPVRRRRGRGRAGPAAAARRDRPDRARRRRLARPRRSSPPMRSASSGWTVPRSTGMRSRG